MVIKKYTTTLLLIMLVVGFVYSQESISVKGDRTIVKIEDGKYKVSVEIDKGEIQGFAKITELKQKELEMDGVFNALNTSTFLIEYDLSLKK